MKVITDGFKAMDAIQWAKENNCTFKQTANTITISEKFMPKMPLAQIRTKGIDPDTLLYIKNQIAN